DGSRAARTCRSARAAARRRPPDRLESESCSTWRGGTSRGRRLASGDERRQALGRDGADLSAALPVRVPDAAHGRSGDVPRRRGDAIDTAMSRWWLRAAGSVAVVTILLIFVPVGVIWTAVRQVHPAVWLA